MYRFQDLTPMCKHLPDYDGHAVYGLVDERGNPILGIFVHKIGRLEAMDGSISTCGGGIRMPPALFMYPTNTAAFTDGLRLSVDMSKKSAGLNVSLGGAKTVVFTHNVSEWVRQGNTHVLPWESREKIWKAMAEKVMPRIPGYVAAEDVGTTVEDAACIKRYAPWALIAGCTKETDSSPTTVDGMLIALDATLYAYCQVFLGLNQFSFAFQGVGAVGGGLVDSIWREGAHDIWVSDVCGKRLETACNNRSAIRVVPTEEIHKQPADVFLPCALGGTLNEKTIPEIKARMVVGCANNQLAEPQDGVRLHERGILYAPAYLANAGGMVRVICSTITGENVEDMLLRIGETLEMVFADSKKYNLPTSQIAESFAVERIAKLMTSPL
jgi:leucine dehydrogenase